MHLPPPTISILVITYNHEPYIEEALSSILAQKVDAKLEIIVSDDCSTDKTVEVIKQIQTQSPHSIKLLTTEKNQGHTRNYERAWKAATGDFIAHCDGDDFWIDPLKLQKQLDFLNCNPNFSFCSHKIKVLINDEYLNDVLPRTPQEVFTTHDLLDACPPHNSSLFFRRGLFTELPSFFFELTGHDWCISILNSLKGPFKILPEAMAVWRMRSNGLWGGENNLFHLLHTEKFLTYMTAYLPIEFKDSISLNLSRNHFKMAEELLRIQRINDAQTAYKKFFFAPHWSNKNLRQTLSLGLRLFAPKTYRSFLGLRNIFSSSRQCNP